MGRQSSEGAAKKWSKGFIGNSLFGSVDLSFHFTIAPMTQARDWILRPVHLLKANEPTVAYAEWLIGMPC